MESTRPLLVAIFFTARVRSTTGGYFACVCPFTMGGGGVPQCSLVPGHFLGVRRKYPVVFDPWFFLGGGGGGLYPSQACSRGSLVYPPDKTGVTPLPVDRLHRRQYASCGHTGGRFCFDLFSQELEDILIFPWTGSATIH